MITESQNHRITDRLKTVYPTKTTFCRGYNYATFTQEWDLNLKFSKFPDNFLYFQISLTVYKIPWPWKKFNFPDFSLTRGKPEGIIIPDIAAEKCTLFLDSGWPQNFTNPDFSLIGIDFPWLSAFIVWQQCFHFEVKLWFKSHLPDAYIVILFFIHHKFWIWSKLCDILKCLFT